MDVFISAVQRTGDLAGVFEYDDSDAVATAYFYLYRTQDKNSGEILGAVHIRSGPWNIREEDIGVRWDMDERRVGLFIFGTLWAVFDADTCQGYGGGYGKNSQPEIPWDEA